MHFSYSIRTKKMALHLFFIWFIEWITSTLDLIHPVLWYTFLMSPHTHTHRKQRKKKKRISSLARAGKASSSCLALPTGASDYDVIMQRETLHNHVSLIVSAQALISKDIYWATDLVLSVHQWVSGIVSARLLLYCWYTSHEWLKKTL